MYAKHSIVENARLKVLGTLNSKWVDILQVLHQSVNIAIACEIGWLPPASLTEDRYNEQ